MNVTITTPPPINVEVQESPLLLNVSIGTPAQVNVTVGGIVAVGGGDSTVITAEAGEVISGGKAVVIGNDGKAYVFNITNEDHALLTPGIANNAAMIGESLKVTVFGKVKEVGSGWTSGIPYYVGSNGLLTATIPSGIFFPIAIGIATDMVSITNNFFKIVQS